MRSRIQVLSAVLLSVALAFASTPAGAADTSGEVPTVVFNHRDSQLESPPSLRLRDGQVFKVLITNTLPDNFIYEVAGIELNPTPPPGGQESEDLEFEFKNKPLFIRHEAKYAGYFVRIKPRPGENTGGLTEIELVISVDTLQWDLGFAGAFTASELSDPVYALESRDVNGEETMFVVRDRDGEDRAKLSVGAFIHLFHTRLPWVALTFGLGINEENKTTYFIGPSWRWGDKGALTAGVTLGSIARLPGGVRENEAAPDANVLGDLGSRTVTRFFVGFSYSFISDIRSRFERPFAGEEDRQVTSVNPQPSTPPELSDSDNAEDDEGNQPAEGEAAEEEQRPPQAP